MTNTPNLPAGSNTVNPFIWTIDASGLIDFVVDVFGAADVAEARTLDTDGLILHSELLIGDSMITVAESTPGWPFMPAFTRVYVDDVAATLARGVARGGEIVTNPEHFFGDTLSRLRDPFGNLWWVYNHDPASAMAWGRDGGDADWEAERGDAADNGGAEDDQTDDWSSFTTPELEYIHTSLIDGMSAIADPRV